MEERFIKIYVLISLWFWAGMLLSSPLRQAFEDMHWRVVERIYDATLWQVIRLHRKIVASISKQFRKISLFMKNCTYELRVSMARLLVSEKLLEELNRKNLVAAIARAKSMNRTDKGIFCEQFENLGHLITGKTIDREEKKSALKTAFELCDTDLFEQIITQIPRAQERILLAFEQAEGNEPYDSVKNEEYRKFIRE